MQLLYKPRSGFLIDVKHWRFPGGEFPAKVCPWFTSIRNSRVHEQKFESAFQPKPVIYSNHLRACLMRVPPCKYSREVAEITEKSRGYMYPGRGKKKEIGDNGSLRQREKVKACFCFLLQNMQKIVAYCNRAAASAEVTTTSNVIKSTSGDLWFALEFRINSIYNFIVPRNKESISKLEVYIYIVFVDILKDIKYTCVSR